MLASDFCKNIIEKVFIDKGDKPQGADRKYAITKEMRSKKVCDKCEVEAANEKAKDQENLQLFEEALDNIPADISKDNIEDAKTTVNKARSIYNKIKDKSIVPEEKKEKLTAAEEKVKEVEKQIEEENNTPPGGGQGNNPPPTPPPSTP